MVIITNNGQVKEYGKAMKKLLVIIAIFSLLASCITIPTPTTPAAASAVVGTAMIVKMLMPIVIAAGIGILIARQMREPDRCESPVTSENLDYCESLEQAEVMRKLNQH